MSSYYTENIRYGEAASCMIVDVEYLGTAVEQWYKQDVSVYNAGVVSDDSSDKESYSNIPEVEATLVHTTVQDHGGCLMGVDPIVTMNLSMQYPTPMSPVRPEFLFASSKVSSLDKSGIRLTSRNFGVVIASLEEGSPFHGSNILPGDRIISVNGIACADADVRRVEKLMSASIDNIMSICVHNKHGDPFLVSSSVQKPSPSSKVGVTMKTRMCAIRFSKVSTDGLFAHSLLRPNHRCVKINGVPCHDMNARMAGDLIAQATDRVTIVSKPQNSPFHDCSAVTIAICDNRKWWQNVSLAAGVAGAGLAAVGTLSYSRKSSP